MCYLKKHLKNLQMDHMLRAKAESNEESKREETPQDLEDIGKEKIQTKVEE